MAIMRLKSEVCRDCFFVFFFLSLFFPSLLELPPLVGCSDGCSLSLVKGWVGGWMDA